MQPYITGNMLTLVMISGARYAIRELNGRYAIAAPSSVAPASACVIFCRTCGMVSHNANDVAQRYCGNCHVFLDNKLRPMPASTQQPAPIEAQKGMS